MRISNKLVRDKIPDIIRNKGGQPITKDLTDTEYEPALLQKLQEEVAEFVADKNVEELADILEVVYALAETLHVSAEALEDLRQKKATERGAFKNRILLVGVED